MGSAGWLVLVGAAFLTGYIDTCVGGGHGTILTPIPNFHPIWALGALMHWDFKAQTSVKCIDGPDAGVIYGTVKWGGYFDLLYSGGLSNGQTYRDPYPEIIQ